MNVTRCFSMIMNIRLQCLLFCWWLDGTISRGSYHWLGGSLGSGYWQLRKFFPPQCRSRWCVIEQSHFVEEGRNKFETETLKFFNSIDEISLKKAPSMLLFSASLHYLPNPQKQLDELLTTKPASCWSHAIYSGRASRRAMGSGGAKDNISGFLPGVDIKPRYCNGNLSRHGYRLVEKQATTRLGNSCEFFGLIFERY